MIDDAAEILGYRFSNERLLCEALTHASFADTRLKSNERMEFLGDAILGYVVCEYLYQQFPELLEGDLTKIKSAVVSRKVCAKISTQIDLASMLNLGKGMCGRPGLPSSVSAAVFESIIAAIYLDGGMQPARDFIVRHLKAFIEEAAASAHQQNFKSVLQQIAQKHMPGTPAYQLVNEKGPDHSKVFEVRVKIGERLFSSSWAKSKKQAEQQAALNALCELGLAETCATTKQVLMVDLQTTPQVIADQVFDRIETDSTSDDGKPLSDELSETDELLSVDRPSDETK